MVDLGGFNANEVDPLRDLEAIPNGKYLAAIVESEEKDTKAKIAGTVDVGSYLQLKFQVLEGEYKGRNLWARLNMKNKSTQAVQIARSELSSICRSIGIRQPKDSSDLHNVPILLRVKCVKRKDNDEMANQITGYAPKPKAGEPEGASSDAPPWAR